MTGNTPRIPRRVLAGALVLALALITALAVMPVSPARATAGDSGDVSPAKITDLTEIEMTASDAALAALVELGVSAVPSERAGYLRADVSVEQMQALSAKGIDFAKGDSFFLVESGERLTGEAWVEGTNGTNVNIKGNDVVWSNINIQGAPLGKTVIRADVSVGIVHQNMCNIYAMVFHPSMTMWHHVWNGASSGPCTADLTKNDNSIHDFDFADINGIWKLQVQETAGATQGYVNYWTIRLYYQSDATPTPTPTRTPTPKPTPKARLSLPVILANQ